MLYKKIFVDAKELLPASKKESEIDKIVKLSRNRGKVYLLVSSDDNQGQTERLINVLKSKYVDVDVTNYGEKKDVPQMIKDIVSEDEHECRQKRDEVRFLVVASGEIKQLMWTHTINEPISHASFINEAEYALHNEFWCENPNINYGCVSERKTEKVVFLDIDGVLNIENRSDKDFVLINEDFVKNLALITYTTDAEVVITSSWRYSLNSDYRSINTGMGECVEMLLSMFKKYHIPVVGITPIHFNGPDGRPFEIRQWLSDKAHVKNFVILDDETFWRWNWLKKYVVCTSWTTFDDNGWIVNKCGLTRELALEAIKILNA